MSLFKWIRSLPTLLKPLLNTLASCEHSQETQVQPKRLTRLGFNYWPNPSQIVLGHATAHEVDNRQPIKPIRLALRGNVPLPEESDDCICREAKPWAILLRVLGTVIVGSCFSTSEDPFNKRFA